MCKGADPCTRPKFTGEFAAHYTHFVTAARKVCFAPFSMYLASILALQQRLLQTLRFYPSMQLLDTAQRDQLGIDNG